MCAWGSNPVPSRMSEQAAMSAFGSDNNDVRLSARRKTYRNETFRGSSSENSLRAENNHGASKGLFYPSCGPACIFVGPVWRELTCSVLIVFLFWTAPKDLLAFCQIIQQWGLAFLQGFEIDHFIILRIGLPTAKHNPNPFKC